MPRYHFHVYDGRDGLDHAGSVLADRHAAGIEALRFAGEVVRADADRLLHGQPWHMEVTDAQSLLILRIDLTLTAFPLGASTP